MKMFIVCSIIGVMLSSPAVHAQSEKSKGMERIEQLRKIRMIEILDLSEDQSIRFFARLHEHQKNTDELNAERMILLDKIERLVRNKVDPEQYREMFTEIDVVDEKLFRDRRAFGEGLHEILSEEQCAKLLLFERQFQKELKDALLQSQKQGEE